MLGLRKDSVAIGGQCQRTVETEVIDRKVFTTVTGITKCDVSALLPVLSSAIQDGGCTCSCNHNGEDDANGQPSAIIIGGSICSRRPSAVDFIIVITTIVVITRSRFLTCRSKGSVHFWNCSRFGPWPVTRYRSRYQ